MIWFITAFFLISNLSLANSEIEAVKQEIVSLAETFKGQGDSDGSKQKQLEVLVSKLLELNPQPPVKERLNLLFGAWKQVWGPYEYRKNDRGVDPTLDVNNIYQVVFNGYYYNVNPSLDRNGKPKKIVLLRGKISLDENSDDTLIARFTNLREIKELPSEGNLKLKDLPALSEAKKLKSEKTTLPSFLVRLFFGGGTLQEVYTDQDLRITFGTGRDQSVSNYVYILTRVK
jgi:hypothetical protein